MGSRTTKVELQTRLHQMFDAFDRLMASHRDFTSGHPCNMEWAKRVESEADVVRHNLTPNLQREGARLMDSSPDKESPDAPTQLRALAGDTVAATFAYGRDLRRHADEIERLRRALRDVVRMTSKAADAPLTSERWLERIEEMAVAALDKGEAD